MSDADVPIRYLVRPPREGLLTSPQARFVEQYPKDLDPEQAAIRAGLDPRAGAELLKQPHVLMAIRLFRQEIRGLATIEVEDIVRKLRLIESADPNELVQLRRVCCRYCHGVDHRYQYTANEFHRARAEHRRAWLALKSERAREDLGDFDEQGGLGFRGNKEPHSDCPECWGEGVVDVWYADTRKLNESGRALYRGVALSRDGTLKVVMADQDAARVLLARHKGMLDDDKREPIREFDPLRLTDDELVRGILAASAQGPIIDLVPEDGPGGAQQGARATPG